MHIHIMLTGGRYLSARVSCRSKAVTSRAPGCMLVTDNRQAMDLFHWCPSIRAYKLSRAVHMKTQQIDKAKLGRGLKLAASRGCLLRGFWVFHIHMCVCIYIYIYICIYVYVYVYVYVCIYTSLSLSLSIYIYTYKASQASMQRYVLECWLSHNKLMFVQWFLNRDTSENHGSLAWNTQCYD